MSCDVWVDALLPAIRPLGAQRVPLGAAQDPDRLEVRRLEQDVRRRGGDLRLLAAHDPGEPDSALAVGNHEILRAQCALDAVERPHLLPLARATRHEPTVQQVEVVGVERTAEREHDVVRHVDDVRDRAHACVAQPALQPQRRLADRDVAERPPDEAETALGILDPDADQLVAVAPRLLPRQRQQLTAEHGRHLARRAVDREQVGAVPGGVEVEHLVDEREHVGEWRPGLERVVEDDDPRVIRPEVEFVLGEDHPLRELAAQLAPLECQPVRKCRARQRDRHLRAGAEVPGAADDRVRPVLPHVYGRQLQPVGVRVLLGLEHVPDAEELEVAGDAHAVDPVHLGRRDRERVRDLLRARLDAHVLA